VHAPAPHTDSAVADSAAATFEAPGYLAGEGGPDVDVTWEPVPVPPPTYRMKPPAPAYEADPTYAPPTYEDVLRTQAPASAGPEPDGELDSILERRWAVND
jgi:hypothetical protein